MTGGAPRVAIVNQGLGLGGTTTFTHLIAGELIRRGVAVLVFAAESDNPCAKEFEACGVRGVLQDENLHILEDRLAAMLRELVAFCPTVVIGNHCRASYEILRYVPEGVMRIGVVHSDYHKVYRELGHYAPWLDHVVGVSSAIAKHVEQDSTFSGISCTPIPYGVADVETVPTRDDEVLKILYLGRLQREQKRVHLFPKIWERLCASGQRFVWTVAGDGPELDYLRSRMVSSDPGQRVEFVGYVEHSAVPELLGGQDILLLASDYEGTPVSVLEAMMCGVVPVVSALESGIGEALAGMDDCLVPVNPPDGDVYAEAIIALAADRVRLSELSIKVREIVRERYALGRQVDRWLELMAQGKGVDDWGPLQPIRTPLAVRFPIRSTGLGRMVRRLLLRMRTSILTRSNGVA